MFDETAFPFTERDGPCIPMDFEFLDTTGVVPAPIGQSHKFLSVGSSNGNLGTHGLPCCHQRPCWPLCGCAWGTHTIATITSVI
jgi:hypothetical protein